MDFCKQFDKISIPMYVCSEKWIVLYRNTACKKYTKAPRVNGDFSKCFFDKQNIRFPERNGIGLFIGCFICDTYKTAFCFEYKGYAAVFFPTLFDFDLLLGDLVRDKDIDTVNMFRKILDSVSDSFSDVTDRYGILEKLRRYAFNVIDNYVALSMFHTESRVTGSVTQIYKFFKENVVNIVNKTGYRVEYDLSNLDELCEHIYVDTTYYAMALTGVLIFCLSISADKCCVVEAEHLGTRVRNTVRFTYSDPSRINTKEEGLGGFMKLNPMEYLNFLPIEELCDSLCWNLGYDVSTNETLNIAVSFDAKPEKQAVFRSGGHRDSLTPEDIISAIVGKTFGLLK